MVNEIGDFEWRGIEKETRELRQQVHSRDEQLKQLVQVAEHVHELLDELHMEAESGAGIAPYEDEIHRLYQWLGHVLYQVEGE